MPDENTQASDETQVDDQAPEQNQPEQDQENEPTSESQPSADSQDGEEPGYFDEKFDPETLPEELRARYGEMNRHFTQRLQAASEQVRAAETATSWLEALNNGETQEAAMLRLGEILGFKVEAIDDDAGESEEDETGEFDDADVTEFRDPRVDELLEKQERQEAQQEHEETERLVAELETKIETGVKELAKKQGIELNDDELELIFDEIAKYGPDENDEPQIDKAFKRITGIATRAVEQFRNSKTDPSVPTPPLSGASSPTPTVQPGDRKARMARAHQVVERAYAQK